MAGKRIAERKLTLEEVRANIKALKTKCQAGIPLHQALRAFVCEEMEKEDNGFFEQGEEEGKGILKIYKTPFLVIPSSAGKWTRQYDTFDQFIADQKAQPEQGTRKGWAEMQTLAILAHLLGYTLIIDSETKPDELISSGEMSEEFKEKFEKSEKFEGGLTNAKGQIEKHTFYRAVILNEDPERKLFLYHVGENHWRLGERNNPGGGNCGFHAIAQRLAQEFINQDPEFAEKAKDSFLEGAYEKLAKNPKAAEKAAENAGDEEMKLGAEVRGGKPEAEHAKEPADAEEEKAPEAQDEQRSVVAEGEESGERVGSESKSKSKQAWQDPKDEAEAQREKSRIQYHRLRKFGASLAKESAKKEQSVSTIQASGGKYNEEKFLEYLMGPKRKITKIGNTDSHEGEGRLFKESEEEPQILSSFKIIGESGKPITDQFAAGAPESPATSSEKNKKIVSYEMVLHKETDTEPEKKVTCWVQKQDTHNSGDIDITHTDENALQKVMVLIKALGSFSTVDVRELDNTKFEVGLSAATRAWVAAKYHEFKTIPDTIDAFSSLTDAQKRAATNLLEKLRNPIPDPSSIVRLKPGK